MRKELVRDRIPLLATLASHVASRPMTGRSGEEDRQGAGHLRVSVFTGKYYHEDNWDRLAEVEQAAQVAAGRESNLLVLPGLSFGYVHLVESKAQDLADRTGLAILAELESPTTLYIPNQPKKPLLKQLFVDGDEANRDPGSVRGVMEALELEGSDRRIDLNGVRMAVLLCGENNILTNPHRGAAAPRYADLAWPRSYDVLLNPSHTRMGNWNLLGSRFEYFSQGGRTAIYCTNNGTMDNWPGKSWKSSLCIYRDGRCIATGDGVLAEHDGLWMDVAPLGEWRMVTVDVQARSVGQGG
ncbi:MAG: hypothetical protein WCD37_05240 [Chloroflexia bacterium]